MNANGTPPDGWRVLSRRDAEMMFERRHTDQRNIRTAHVYKMSIDMKEGRFYGELAAPIAFDTDGNLINGQHTLAAFLESGLPEIGLRVVTGVPADAIIHIDQGINRSDADALKISGVPCSQRRQAIAKAMMNGTLRAWKSTPTRRPQLAKFLSEHKETLDAACGWAAKAPSPIVAAVARAFYHEEHSKLADFCSIIETGDHNGQRGSSSAVRIRELWISGRAGQGYPAREDLFRKTERAIQAFCRGEHLSKLMAASGELYPLPGEPKAENTEQEHRSEDA